MKNYYQMGICQECDELGFNGFIQFNPIKKEYYCLDCPKRLEEEGKSEKEIYLLSNRWTKNNWDSLVKKTREDFKVNDEIKNLKELNSL